MTFDLYFNLRGASSPDEVSQVLLNIVDLVRHVGLTRGPILDPDGREIGRWAIDI